LAVCALLAAATAVLAIGPGTAFPGWQWVCLVLAVPVVSWGAWPIHRAAWLGLGRRPATLDSLVSASVSASFAWSVYALLAGGAGAAGPRPFAPTFGPASGQVGYLAVAAGMTAIALAARYMQARSQAWSAGPPAVTDRLAAGSAGNARHDSGLTVPAGTLAGRAAAVFVPCVLALAVVTLGFWCGAGLPSASAWSATVAVLVVACPCALGLATPTALLAARARGAELGILVRNARSLETAGRIRALVLDLASTLPAEPGSAAGDPGLAAALARLRRLGLMLFVLTGDTSDTGGAGRAEATRLGIPAGNLFGAAGPAGQADVVRELQRADYCVAMVGGAGSAAALAAADLGIATGSRAGVADLALLGADPAVIADAIQLARATSAIIRVNLAWAFGVNAIAIPLAALGYLGPLSAGIVGAASSVIVVANSLLLRGYRPGRRRR
jgi:cation transport ATPase